MLGRIAPVLVEVGVEGVVGGVSDNVGESVAVFAKDDEAEADAKVDDADDEAAIAITASSVMIALVVVLIFRVCCGCSFVVLFVDNDL